MTSEPARTSRREFTVIAQRDPAGWLAYRAIKPGDRATGGTLEQALSGLMLGNPGVFSRKEGVGLVVWVNGEDLGVRA